MQTAMQPDFNEVEMFKKYEEMTNIHIEWEMIPQEFVAERRKIIMASGELPTHLCAVDFLQRTLKIMRHRECLSN